MTSLLTHKKQIPGNAGYYITVGSLVPSVAGATFYYNAGPDATPLISTNIYALSSNTSTILKATGTVLKDMGKTLVSSGRVFRKVQLVCNTSSILVGGTDGVSGVDGIATNSNQVPNYFTGYIELPGTGGMTSGVTGVSPVARLG